MKLSVVLAAIVAALQSESFPSAPRWRAWLSSPVVAGGLPLAMPAKLRKLLRLSAGGIFDADRDQVADGLAAAGRVLVAASKRIRRTQEVT